MARVKRGVTARRRHKTIIGRAKGYYNARRKVFRVANQAVIKAGQYAYIGRKQRKRKLGRPVEIKPANEQQVKKLLAGGRGAK